MGLSFDLLSVPEENGQILATPAASDYKKILTSNAGLNTGIVISGQPLGSFRKIAREQAIDAARGYTQSLGLDVGKSSDPQSPIIASGHQPMIFHPGVMIKPLALARVAGSIGAQAVFINVDSDEFRAENILVPTYERGKLERMEFPLFPMAKRCLFETAKAEPLEDFMDRLAALGGFMSAESLAGPRKEFINYLESLRQVRLDFPDYMSRVISMRRAWLGSQVDGLLEAPVSLLSQGSAFLSFACHIMSDIERFADCYNAALDKYRIERKLRYPANPFPNLERKGAMVQAPFWEVGTGGRTKLYVKPGSGQIVREAGDPVSLKDVEEGKISIRPKAITLSFYLRMVLSDMFIHGVGGAKYDHVTDEIIEQYFKATPPGYACLSATMWINTPAEDPRSKIKQLQWQLRQIDQHPEIAGQGRPEVDRLAIRKKELVGRIKEPGVDKKSIGAQIGKLNQEMAKQLSADKHSIKEELDRLGIFEKERQVAQARDYPYFLMDREDIISMANLA